MSGNTITLIGTDGEVRVRKCPNGTPTRQIEISVANDAADVASFHMSFHELQAAVRSLSLFVLPEE